MRSTEQMELLPQAAQAIRKLNEAGWLVILATNQPVLARGEVSEEELTEIHNKMETLLGKEGAYVDAIYYCPHHPDKGFAGERPEYKIECSCRKPKPGLLFRAAQDYHIDLKNPGWWEILQRIWEPGKRQAVRQLVFTEKNPVMRALQRWQNLQRFFAGEKKHEREKKRYGKLLSGGASGMLS